MTANVKNQLLEVVKWLLIPALTALVTATYAVGTFNSDFRALSRQVEANRQEGQKDLANAISVRKADQAVMLADLEATKEILRNTVPILKELSKGQGETKEAVARLEVSVSYLTKSIDELKSQQPRK